MEICTNIFVIFAVGKMDRKVETNDKINGVYVFRVEEPVWNERAMKWQKSDG